MHTGTHTLKKHRVPFISSVHTELTTLGDIKLKKKYALIAGGVVALLLVIMIIVPLLFEDQIAGLIKKQINKKLKATVNFSDTNLNLFEHFPDITLNIDDLTIVNREPFKGDTLLRVSQFEASIDLWSVIGGDQMEINSVSLIKPDIFLYVTKDSVANYDITIPTPEEKPEETKFNITLKKYNVESANIAYIDETSGIKAFITDMNHSGSGDFSQDLFSLDTKTAIEKLTVEMNSIPFLKNTKIGFDMKLDMNLPAMTFKFMENELRLNDLKVNFGGMVRMNKDSSIYADVNFKSANNNFKEIISLIPAVYSADFASAQASGTMSLQGAVKGTYKEKTVPAFNIALKVNNGSLKYAKLPSRLNNVNVDLNIDNPGGSADKTIVNMSRMHFELGSDPFDVRLLVKTPESSPWIQTAAKGRLNLGTIKNAISLKDVKNLTGLVNADFEASGYLADIQKKKAENISAKGNMSLSNFVYEGAQLSQPVKISNAVLNFTPKNFVLQNMNMTIGSNDISAKGSLSNVISFVLSDAVMSGNLQISSGYFNLNPFMQNDETETVKAKETSKPEAVELPDNINFTMNASFNKLIYDNLTLEKVNGVIILRDGRLNLQNLKMNLMGGMLTASGYYENKSGSPDIAFNLGINGFDIQKTYESFVTVQTFAPMAKYIHGNFDAGISLNSSLNGSLVPEWKSFNGKGNLNLKSAKVNGFKPFNMVSSALKIDALKDPALYNIKPDFAIRNGQLIVAPFQFTVAGNQITMGGTNGLDKSLDYFMEMMIPASSLKSGANQALSKLFKKDVTAIKSDKLPVRALIKGTIDNPSVSTSAGSIAGEAAQTVKEEVKSAITKEVETRKEEYKKQAEQRIDTVKKKVEDEAKKRLKDLFKRK